MFTPCDHLEICGSQAFVSAVETDGNRLATNSADTITTSVGPSATKMVRYVLIF
jgi:hypothetical protein